MLFERLAVMEYEKAVMFAGGRIKTESGPGEYFLSKYFPRPETKPLSAEACLKLETPPRDAAAGSVLWRYA